MDLQKPGTGRAPELRITPMRIPHSHENGELYALRTPHSYEKGKMAAGKVIGVVKKDK